MLFTLAFSLAIALAAVGKRIRILPAKKHKIPFMPLNAPKQPIKVMPSRWQSVLKRHLAQTETDRSERKGRAQGQHNKKKTRPSHHVELEPGNDDARASDTNHMGNGAAIATPVGKRCLA